MKNLVSLAVVMLITANIFAQTGDPAPRITYDTLPPMPDTLAINAARKGHFVFFDVGGGTNNVAFSVGSNGKKAPGFGLSARLGYRYFFAPNWGIGVGVNYNTYQGITRLHYDQYLETDIDTLANSQFSEQERTRNFYAAFDDLKERITMSAITFPIGLYYQQSLSSKFRIGAGVSFSYTQILTKKYKTTKR